MNKLGIKIQSGFSIVGDTYFSVERWMVCFGIVGFHKQTMGLKILLVEYEWDGNLN